MKKQGSKQARRPIPKRTTNREKKNDLLVGRAELEHGDFRTDVEANAKQVAYATADVHAAVP